MNLYVGNLPYATTESELRYLFSEFGVVASATVITDRATGMSKGFGFVEMSDADAQRAIAKLNDAALGGRRLRVNEAKRREQRA